MKKILDEYGRVVENTYRTPSGAIVVNDSAARDKYKVELKRVEKINQLEEEVKEIKDLLKVLIGKLE